MSVAVLTPFALVIVRFIVLPLTLAVHVAEVGVDAVPDAVLPDMVPVKGTTTGKVEITAHRSS